jgi:hypothetical protein
MNRIGQKTDFDGGDRQMPDIDGRSLATACLRKSLPWLFCQLHTGRLRDWEELGVWDRLQVTEAPYKASRLSRLDRRYGSTLRLLGQLLPERLAWLTIPAIFLTGDKEFSGVAINSSIDRIVGIDRRAVNPMRDDRSGRHKGLSYLRPKDLINAIVPRAVNPMRDDGSGQFKGLSYFRPKGRSKSQIDGIPFLRRQLNSWFGLLYQGLELRMYLGTEPGLRLFL